MNRLSPGMFALCFILGFILILMIGILMVVSPHFPDSKTSEEQNKDAYIAVTTIGSIIIIHISFYILYYLFHVFTYFAGDFFIDLFRTNVNKGRQNYRQTPYRYTKLY